MARMAKKRKSTRTRKPKDQPPPLLPKLNREAVAIIFLLVALATLVTLLFPAPLTRDLNSIVWGWFGLCSYIVPIIVGGFGIGLLWTKVDEEYKLKVSEITGWILVLLFLLTSGHLVGLLFDQNNLVMGQVGQALADALSIGIGGVGTGLTILAMGLAGFLLSLSIGPIEVWGAIVLVWQLISNHLKEKAPPEYKINLPETYTKPPRSNVPILPQNAPSKEALPVAVAVVKPNSKPEIPKPTRPTATRPWQLPPTTLLDPPPASGELSQTEIRQKVKTIEDTLLDFGVQVRVLEVNPGPTVTQFGIEPGYHERYDRNGALVKREKVKVAEISGLANDLALAMAAPSIRIEAPVPGRAVVGIEVPNATSAMVSLRGVIETQQFQKIRLKSKLTIALGQNVSGQPIVADLAKMPHLLIAGATGAGKSVCINSIIASLIMHCTPDELRLLMIDPKRVELTSYNDVPHLLTPVVTEVERAVGVLALMLREMDERYKKFQEIGVRDIERYNKTISKEGFKDGHKPMPYTVVIIDELADLMMTSPDDIERTLCRLAQLARATGIHLVVATQRPSVDVVTGLIKANIPTRIAFAVTSQVDSRTILDMVGAEKLLGKGDMLYMPTDAAKPHRAQGTYVSDDEIEQIVGFWKEQGPVNYIEAFTNASSEEAQEAPADELYNRAVELAQQHARVSTSLLQRRLRVGYSRAARLIDMMEEAEIVGPSEGGGKSREVLTYIEPRELNPEGQDITAECMKMDREIE